MPATEPLELAPLLLLAYGVGVVLAVCPLVLGVVALVRLRRSGRAAPVAVQRVFDELAAGCRARLIVSDRVASPLCFGLFSPVVVIPKSLANTASEMELRWVFAHELDHLKRGDPWAGWWVAVTRAVYFFLPWFWRVKRELVLAQEQLADAAAVAAGGRGEDYAAFLVRLSGVPSRRRHPVGAAGVRAGKSDLFWRVTMLLASQEKAPVRASRWWSAMVAAGVLGVSVVLSGVGFAIPPDEEKPVEKKKADDEKPVKAKPTETKTTTKDDVQVGPPPQLAALRKAVEAAAKQGENVDDIRKQLAELEKALAGKAWVKPKPAPQPDPAPVPQPPVFVPPQGGFNFQPPAVRVVPNFGGGEGGFNLNFGGVNPETLKKAQDLLQKAQEDLRANPNNREAFEKAMAEFKKLMGDAAPNGMAFDGGVVTGFSVGPDGAVRRFGGGAPALTWTTNRSNDGRLGVRLDKVPAVVVDQLGLKAGEGLVIQEVRKGTAAEKAGLKANDILIEFAGKSVPGDVGEFTRAVGAVKKGDKVDAVVVRKGKKETVKGIELPEAAKAAEFRAVPVPVEGLPPVPAVPPVPPRAGRLEATPIPVRPAPPLPPVAAAARSSMSVSISDGNFTIESEQDGVKFSIEGTIDGGKAVPSKIQIKDGDTKVDATSVEKVPAAYRDRVTKLLGSIRAGGR